MSTNATVDSGAGTVSAAALAIVVDVVVAAADANAVTAGSVAEAVVLLDAVSTDALVAAVAAEVAVVAEATATLEAERAANADSVVTVATIAAVDAIAEGSASGDDRRENCCNCELHVQSKFRYGLRKFRPEPYKRVAFAVKSQHHL